MPGMADSLVASKIYLYLLGQEMKDIGLPNPNNNMETEIGCEFEHKGWKCQEKKVVGIARGKFLCQNHFKMMVRDNILRHKKGMDFPNDFSMIKRDLPRGRLSYKLGNMINNKEKEVEDGNNSRNNEC